MTNLSRILASGIIFTLSFVATQLYISNSMLKDELNLNAFEIDTLEYKVDSIKSEMFIKERELDKCKDLQKINNVEH
jgi:hypothetical protein